LRSVDKVENFELEWTDENSFIVKGFTEPRNPTPLENKIMMNNRVTFNIVAEDKNDYHFNLGNEATGDIIYSGKFIKER